MQMEATATLIVERLGHERGLKSFMTSDLLHPGLHPERPICRVNQLGMVEVDFELTGTELMIRRRDLHTGVAQVAQHLQQDSARITLTSDDVHIADDVGVTTHPIGTSGIWLHQIELELGTNDGTQAKRCQLVRHVTRHISR